MPQCYFAQNIRDSITVNCSLVNERLITINFAKNNLFRRSCAFGRGPKFLNALFNINFNLKYSTVVNIICGKLICGDTIKNVALPAC